VELTRPQAKKLNHSRHTRNQIRKVQKQKASTNIQGAKYNSFVRQKKNKKRNLLYMPSSCLRSALMTAYELTQAVKIRVRGLEYLYGFQYSLLVFFFLAYLLKRLNVIERRSAVFPLYSCIASQSVLLYPHVM